MKPGRARELAVKLLVLANGLWSSNDVTEIEALIESAIQTAVNEALDEVQKTFDDAWDYAVRHPDNAGLGLPSIKDKILELKKR